VPSEREREPSYARPIDSSAAKLNPIDLASSTIPTAVKFQSGFMVKGFIVTEGSRGSVSIEGME
jgi:hypothetical protein